MKSTLNAIKMGTVSRTLRFQEKLWGDLAFLAEKDSRSVNAFIALQLQNIVDSLKQEGGVNIQDLTRPTHEIKPFEQPQTNYSVNTVPNPVEPLKSQFEAFKEEVKATTWSGDLHKVMKRIQSEPLAAWQKKVLQALADEHRKEFQS